MRTYNNNVFLFFLQDGHYYFPVLDREVTRIRSLCAQCEQDMQNNALPEEGRSLRELVRLGKDLFEK